MPAPATPEKSGAQSGALARRIISALILAPLVLGLVYGGGWPFLLMMAAAGVIMTAEWVALVFGATPSAPRRAEFWLVAATAVLATLLMPVAPLAALGLAGTGLGLGIAWRTMNRQPVGVLAFGVPYLVLPLIAMVWLRADPVYGRWVLFWLLATVWATDICAYFTGRAIGGPKIAPIFSPSKTWAGLGGGMAGAAAVGVVTATLLGADGSPVALALLGAGLAAVAQIGDFTESALKRRAGVKDSGTLIPGHGGILDRVDGLMFAAVGAAIVALVHQGPSLAAGVLIWQ